MGRGHEDCKDLLPAFSVLFEDWVDWFLNKFGSNYCFADNWLEHMEIFWNTHLQPSYSHRLTFIIAHTSYILQSIHYQSGLLAWASGSLEFEVVRDALNVAQLLHCRQFHPVQVNIGWILGLSSVPENLIQSILQCSVERLGVLGRGAGVVGLDADLPLALKVVLHGGVRRYFLWPFSMFHLFNFNYSYSGVIAQIKI